MAGKTEETLESKIQELSEKLAQSQAEISPFFRKIADDDLRNRYARSLRQHQ